MRKIVIHSPGSYDKLKIEQHPTPEISAHEILVEVAATGVNYADVCIRWGVYESAKQYVGWPITPGFEFSGRVLRVGSEVRRFKSGDRVFGVTRFGGYASELAVSENLVYPLPEKLDDETAAGFPTIFLTAYHALFQAISVRPGMTLLVHSAGGGVGSALVQLGKAVGCKVVGVVGSSHKVEFVRKLGADRVIDKSREDLWRSAEAFAPEGYDVVLDANGYVTLREGYRHLRPTGRLVTYGFHSLLPRTGGRINYLKAAWGLLQTPRFDPMRMVMENKGVVGFNLSFLFERQELFDEAMGQLLRWLAEGKIHPPTVRSFAFEDVGEAHRELESGKTIGKLVLVMR